MSSQQLQDIKKYHDSLRYSMDTDIDYEKSDTLSYSTEGPDIQFIFEDDSPGQFHYENVPPITFTKERRKNIFAKYKQNEQEAPQTNKNGLIESFDEIFNFHQDQSNKAKEEKKQQNPIQEKKNQKEEKLKIEENLRETLDSSRKQKMSVQIETEGNVSIVENYFEKGEDKKKQTSEQASTMKKNPAVKISFNYVNSSQNGSSKAISESSRSWHSSTDSKASNEKKDQKLVFVSGEKAIGKNQNVSEQDLSIEQYGSENTEKLSNPLFEEEERVVKFLRKVKKMNSIYPNLHNPSINLEVESQFHKILAVTFEKALNTLEGIGKQVFEKLKKPIPYSIQFNELQFFMNSGWEKKKQINQIDEIKPKERIQPSNIVEDKLFAALKNYREVIDYYKGYEIKSSLDSDAGKKSYWKIRQKFWALERNLRSISEDVYRMYLNLGYPHFFYQYLSVLRSPAPSKKEKRIADHHKTVLAHFVENRQKGDPLSCSEVGLAVKMKLEKELRFLHPF